ncbi:hypothetical protein Tco_1119265 [Tanacetum coccineum]
MGDPNPCAQNAIITMMVHVLLNATNTTKLAILLMIVEVRQMLTMLTIRGALGRVRSLLVLSVEFKEGHFKRECPKLKNNNNHGNQVGGGNAPAKVYTVGHTGTNPNFNVMTDHYYDVELADWRIIGLNTILRGCTLNFLNHPFNIELMPVELGSIDALIGMDWLGKYEAIIVYCGDDCSR